MSERRSTRQRETTVVAPAWVRVLVWIGFPLVGAGATWLLKSAIIAQLTQANAALAQRVPELEAPQRPEDASEGGDGAPVQHQGPYAAQEQPLADEEPPRRSWWRAFFGLD
jgi:hypothetical protein